MNNTERELHKLDLLIEVLEALYEHGKERSRNLSGNRKDLWQQAYGEATIAVTLMYRQIALEMEETNE